LFQVIRQGHTRIMGEKHIALGFAFALHAPDPGAMGCPQGVNSSRVQMIPIQIDQLLAA
jgi:hypothetical protein